MLRKIIDKIKAGMLRDILHETKWIYSYTAQYKKGIVVFIILGLLSTVLGLLGSLASKYLIDAVTSQQNSRLVSILSLYIGFELTRIAVTAVTRRFSAKLSVRASNEIRADVFRQFLTVDWQASLEYHSGDLLTRINGDVSTVADSVLGWIPSLITSLVQFLATLTVIFIYDPIMAVIALLGAPITVILSRFFLFKMRTFSQEVRKKQSDLTAFYEESLQNLQAIKSFDLHQQFLSRLDALQALYKDVSLDYNLFAVRASLVMSVTGFAVSGMCFLWGVWRLWNGAISFGTMVLFIQLAALVSTSFSSLVGLVPSAISATVSAQRIMKILALPHEDMAASPEAQAVIHHARETGVSVDLRDVRFSYQNGRRIFDGFDLHANGGEIIGIVSPSGGGKTTLIRMLLGLIAPQDGTITLSAGNATAPLSPCMRGLITYVAQEKVVFSGTIAQSLRMTNPLADDAQLQHALELACAWDFVSALSEGIHTSLGERGSGLSEGQIQRLAIARALVSDAPIMLLDEATSALDIDTEHTVLRNILSSGNRTVIVTTHRPTVLLSCHHVVRIENGKSIILDDEAIREICYHKD